MSWSISAVGKPAATAASIATQIEGQSCSEPEQSIKAKVGEIIAIALAAFPDTNAVEVTASGSQSCIDYTDPAKGATNSLTVNIKPLWNFKE